ncbi:elongation factor 1-beta [Candidatus Woesearchaeota archaeon]|nr:MAG: elongation factor 1-beta [Candidatus Woesearchaeota archaeon]
MADVVVTLKVMPKGVDVDLNALAEKVKEKVSAFGGEVGKVEEKPVAFGLKSLMIYFVMPEEKGSTEPLEKEIEMLDDVESVDVVDVRRAVG